MKCPVATTLASCARYSKCARMLARVANLCPHHKDRLNPVTRLWLPATSSGNPHVWEASRTQKVPQAEDPGQVEGRGAMWPLNKMMMQ